MRLLKLVPCGCPAVADEEPPGSTSSSTLEKHRRRSSRVRSAATTWQPSLGAISEDLALYTSPAKTAPSPPEKPGNHLKKRSARRTTAAQHGEDKGGFRRHDTQAGAGIPAFAPTLFMF